MSIMRVALRARLVSLLVVMTSTQQQSSASMEHGIAFSTLAGNSSRKKHDALVSFDLVVAPPCKSATASRSSFVSSSTRICVRRIVPLFSANDDETTDDGLQSEVVSRRKQIRKKVTQLARNIVAKPIEAVAPMPKAIAEVLKDATFGAAGMAVEGIILKTETKRTVAEHNEAMASALDADALVDEAFASAEISLQEAEKALAQKSLQEAEKALELVNVALRDAKVQARQAIEAAEAAAVGEAQRALAVAEEAEKAITGYIATGADVDVSTLTYDDVGYHLSEEMSPPFINEDQCLIPGEAVARCEKAPENSRRIFAGIDIMASVDDVWKVLTDYANLQNVVPNLVVNDVVELYDGKPADQLVVDTLLPDDLQCQMISQQMKGAKLKQVGGAKVVGIKFSAKTNLEVREWPQGLPDFAHFNDDVYEGKSREERAKENAKVKLQRCRFPRPFALSKLPTRDISMQSIENDDGEFRMYQGVWRMQPLPGCAPAGQEAMRLTYAVEVSPRSYLPVQLVEGRIVQDLCTNLVAIRDHVSQVVPVS